LEIRRHIVERISRRSIKEEASMTIRYTMFRSSWSDLPFGSKLRLALAGLGVLGLLALVLSLSVAIFLVLAPIMIVAGAVGSMALGRKAKRTAKRNADDQTIEAQYVVIEPEPSSALQRELARRDRDRH
jgi:hypothetical protein